MSDSSEFTQLQHRDSQFEVRDLRAYSSKTKPDARFGYEAVGRRANAAATKGDIKNYTFAFGDECGIVRLWDLRNTKNVVQQVSRSLNLSIMTQSELRAVPVSLGTTDSSCQVPR